MTPCEVFLQEKLTREGFVSIEQFMTFALYHPDFGYYTNHVRFGTRGDFMTAPEISPLFGATLAHWARTQYQRLGCPAFLNLMELGPGTGTLMVDFLTQAQQWPNFFKALRLYLVEISPSLTRQQQSRLAPFKMSQFPRWQSSLEAALSLLKKQASDTPTLIFGNEFLDALPLHQYEYQNNQWRERGLILDQITSSENPKIVLGHSAPLSLPADVFHPADCRGPCIIEYRPRAQAVLQQLLDHIDGVKGALLLLDYGYEQGHGDSFQAITGHHHVPVFHRPGEVDLTAHVDFGALGRHIGPRAHVLTQGSFLTQHGIIKEAVSRAHAQTFKTASTLSQTSWAEHLHKLTSPTEMGTLFKVLIVESITYEL